MALETLERLTESERQAGPYLEWLRVRAEEIIFREWHSVEGLAEALLRHGTLSGEEAVRIMRGVQEQRRQMATHKC
jgi:hypothetical protein